MKNTQEGSEAYEELLKMLGMDKEQKKASPIMPIVQEIVDLNKHIQNIGKK